MDILADVSGSSSSTSPPKIIRSAWFVNSSLGQFIESVHAVTDRFPFDSTSLKVSKHLSINEWDLSDDQWDDLWREHDQAEHDLTELLQHIDAAAMANRDGYWRQLVADVQMGNYNTRDYVNVSHE